MKRILFTVFALLLSLPLAALADPCADPVSTTDGPVSGVKVANGACSWKGIPYATPPVGDLRFRAPRPPAPHPAVLVAQQYGFACMQKESWTSGGEAQGFAEDCLTLNIWAPEKSGSFPVMFFIHGGGFRSGSGTYDMYNGSRLAAERDVVVVTINYRIGPLGYLALPELTAEDAENGSGNMGLLDQVRALNWVKDNIAGFRGDPQNVTVFGQSAGGMSITYLMVSPRAAGLFQRAVNMSGPYDQIRPIAAGYEVGKEWARKVGCAGADVVSCLRRKPAKAFLPKDNNMMLNGGVTLMPWIDGKIIPDEPLKLIREGKYMKVPVMLGTTKEELKLYTLTFSGLGLWTRSFTTAVLRWLAGRAEADKILDLYDYQGFKRPVDLLIVALTDATFTSKIFMEAEALADQGTPVWFYRFDWNDTRMPTRLGAFHGLDLPLVFGTLDIKSQLAKLLATKKGVARAKPLSDAMMTYYSNFACNGDPNGAGVPDWPAYNTKDRIRIYFDNPVSVSPLTDEEIRRYKYFGDRRIDQVFSEGIGKVRK